MTDITKQLAEALRHIENAATDLRFQRYEIRAAATEALAAHDAEQVSQAKPAPAQAVPAGLYVGLIERLMRLSTRLGIADGDSVEHFAASLEDRLYAICRSAESLLDSLAPAAPAPEAQAAGQDERAAFEVWYRQDLVNKAVHERPDAQPFRAWQARAELAQRQPLTEWHPIETAPKDGRKMLLFYLNENGQARRVIGGWVNDEDAAESDTDGVGLEAGWYERIDNWPDYYQVAIHEGEPTHWMPLPAAPGAHP